MLTYLTMLERQTGVTLTEMEVFSVAFLLAVATVTLIGLLVRFIWRLEWWDRPARVKRTPIPACQRKARLFTVVRDERPAVEPCFASLVD